MNDLKFENPVERAFWEQVYLERFRLMAKGVPGEYTVSKVGRFCTAMADEALTSLRARLK